MFPPLSLLLLLLGGFSEKKKGIKLTFFNALCFFLVDFWFDVRFWDGDALRQAAKSFSTSREKLVNFLLKKDLGSYSHVFVVFFACLGL